MGIYIFIIIQLETSKTKNGLTQKKWMERSTDQKGVELTLVKKIWFFVVVVFFFFFKYVTIMLLDITIKMHS